MNLRKLSRLGQIDVYIGMRNNMYSEGCPVKINALRKLLDVRKHHASDSLPFLYAVIQNIINIYKRFGDGEVEMHILPWIRQQPINVSPNNSGWLVVNILKRIVLPYPLFSRRRTDYRCPGKYCIPNFITLLQRYHDQWGRLKTLQAFNQVGIVDHVAKTFRDIFSSTNLYYSYFTRPLLHAVYNTWLTPVTACGSQSTACGIEMRRGQPRIGVNFFFSRNIWSQNW